MRTENHTAVVVTSQTLDDTHRFNQLAKSVQIDVARAKGGWVDERREPHSGCDLPDPL